MKPFGIYLRTDIFESGTRNCRLPTPFTSYGGEMVEREPTKV